AALANLRQTLEESGATVTREDLPTLPADRALISQLFQNLVGNAVKYRQPGRAPAIHVSARRQNEREWVIGVGDNGIGIDPRHAEQSLYPRRLHPLRCEQCLNLMRAGVTRRLPGQCGMAQAGKPMEWPTQAR